VRHSGKRYRHLLYEYEEIEETPKKIAVKRQCPEKTKRGKSRKCKKTKNKNVTPATKTKKILKLENKKIKRQETEQEHSNEHANDCHLSFRDQDEEVFAEDFNISESEEIKSDILSYTENGESDLGLSIRGVKWRPEVTIEALNIEGMKLPLTGSTPMADNSLLDFPALSPINVLTPFGFFEFNSNLGKADLTEISNKTSESA
jgi:hypothetical protein